MSLSPLQMLTFPGFLSNQSSTPALQERKERAEAVRAEQDAQRGSGPSAGGGREAGPQEIGASQVVTLEGHQSEVFICAWSPAAPLLASGCGQGLGAAWEDTAGRSICALHLVMPSTASGMMETQHALRCRHSLALVLMRFAHAALVMHAWHSDVSIVTARSGLAAA